MARAALLIGGGLLGLALCEAGMRALGISFPDFYVEDPILGRVHRPEAEGWWTEEGRSYVRITADGRRDRERPTVKPPGTYRIAVLGDSYAAAFELPPEQAFWAVMEAALVDCPALERRRPEAINFGVGGYGTASQRLVLEHRVWPYEPDLVLLAFLTGNDVGDNVRDLKGSGRSAYFELREGELVLEEEFVRKREKIAQSSRIGGRWIKHLRIVQAAARAKRVLKRRLRRSAPIANAEPKTFGEGLYDAVFAPPEREVWKRAWTITEALLVSIRDEVRARGARFALVSLSNPIQVDPDPEARQRFAKAMGREDLFYPDRRLAALAETERIPFLALAPQLLAWAEAQQTCVHGFPNAIPCGGHWNEQGHRLAGEAIASWLCDELREDASARPAAERGDSSVVSMAR